MVRQVRDELRLARKYWRNYIFQSLLATASLFCVLIFLEQQEEVIMASLGATAFVVFAMPENPSAQSRNVIGGHLVGMLCGFMGYYTLNLLPQTDHFTVLAGIHAITVGLSILMMVLLNTEHPPAAGTALGVVFNGLSFQLAFSILFFCVIFSAIRVSLKNHLRDLT